MGKDVIIACDFKNKEETLNFLEQFTEEKPFIKIGMELFYSEGPNIVRELKKMGHKIFLDLKLHDIPNTVQKAMTSLLRLDVDMCNVHATGTIEMMKAAMKGLTREAGAEVLGIASIFTYNMNKSKQRLEEASVKNISLSNFDVMVEVAAEEGYIKNEDIERLIAFRNNPSDESWIK